jgi:hypothetical protein
MAIPTTMADLFVARDSNSPAGSEAVFPNNDEFLRITQAILRRTNAKGADLLSSTSVAIGASTTGDFIDITGTSTITSFDSIAAGIERVVRFTGALTLTHSANIILPDAANIQTKSGDIGVFRSLGSGSWICETFKRQSFFDLSSYAGAAFQLAVGDTAFYSFSGITFASPKILYLTTSAGQSYQFTLSTSLSVGTADHILKINGAYGTTTYQQGTVLSAGGGAGSGSIGGTGLGLGHGSLGGVMATVDCASGVTTSNVSHAYNDGVAYGCIISKNSQSSTCTAFTDLAPTSGTMSGTLTIKRVS